MSKIFDGPFEYQMQHKTIQPRCNLKVYEVGRGQPADRTLVIVFSEPDGYEGVSVTNGCEAIATAVIHSEDVNPKAKDLPNPDRIVWVERYPDRGRNYPESFDLVTLRWFRPSTDIAQSLGWNIRKRAEAHSPVWQRVSREWVETLTGEAF